MTPRVLSPFDSRGRGKSQNSWRYHRPTRDKKGQLRRYNWNIAFYPSNIPKNPRQCALCVCGSLEL